MLSKLLKSKTLIFNTLVVIGGTLGYLQGNEVIVQHPEIVAALVTASGVVNFVLRLVTTLPVWEK